MAKVPRSVLKEYFQTGDKPTQPQFSNMLDSMVNFVDDRSFIGLRDYDPALYYLPGDCAVFNNQVIKCITATTGVFNPANWQIIAAFGSVNFVSAWDTQNNNPPLQSSVGTKGFYYVVTNASPDPNLNTELDGIDDWGNGDWAIFDGSVWNKVDNSENPVVASGVSFAPFGPITATNVQSAIEEVFNDLDDSKLNTGGGSMSGPLILSGDPTNPLGAATKQYVDAGDGGLQSQINGKVSLSGDTMTGNLILNTDPTVSLGAATKQYVDAGDGGLQSQINGKVSLSGDTMTGDLILNADPTASLGAATKQYVDAGYSTLQAQVADKVRRGGDSMTGLLILSGDPVAGFGAATKRYVDTVVGGKLSTSGGTMSGDLILNADPTAALGAATKQYVDAGDATKLNLAGGTLTGSLILNADPSAALGAATKQYVDAAVGGVPSQVKTVAIPLTFAGAVQGFTSAAWSRFPTAATQLRVVVPPVNTLFPGTSAMSAQLVVDYMTTSATTTGNIGLFDFTTFPAVGPFGNSSQPLGATNNVWTILTTGSFPLTAARSFEIIVQRTAGAGTVFVETVTLLLTYT